jgi:invasion protein IalB
MRINSKFGAVAVAVSALAIAVPAGAHPSGSDHPSGTNHPNGSNHSSGSHRCTAHKVAYIVYGTIDRSQLMITVTNGVAAGGTLEVNVTRTNHWARGDKQLTQPVGYQLSSGTKVKFDGVPASITSSSSPERVKLIGYEMVVTNRNCLDAGPVGVGSETFRMVVLHPAAS